MGFQIIGGKKPYNLTLAAPNSTLITNVTMGPTDDVFTYIDRADPNSGLMGELSFISLSVVTQIFNFCQVAVVDA